MLKISAKAFLEASVMGEEIMDNSSKSAVSSQVPIFREKHYTEAAEILIDDARAVSAIAVKSVSINCSGGFPARNPFDNTLGRKK